MRAAICRPHFHPFMPQSAEVSMPSNSTFESPRHTIDGTDAQELLPANENHYRAIYVHNPSVDDGGSAFLRIGGTGLASGVGGKALGPNEGFWFSIAGRLIRPSNITVLGDDDAAVDTILVP